MKKVWFLISQRILLTLVLFFITLPAIPATYVNSYKPIESESTDNISMDENTATLPSQRTLNKMEGMASSTQNIILLGDAEDPFDPGAGTDNPDDYNDVPIGDGLSITLLFAFCYGLVLWFRYRKIGTPIGVINY